MGKSKRPRNVNKRYAYVNEVSPSKDGDSAKKSSSRKRKLSDMLGPRWTNEELTRFYDAYRKHGKEWKKVAGAVRNRSAEMVEALYTMNRAYLSLPHGTASSAGLTAMMTDHYSNLAGSDSDEESNDGAGSSRRAQKRLRGKVHLTTSKALDEQFVSRSPLAALDYGCLSMLKSKRSGGTRPRPVGKRTPRVPVSINYGSIKGERYFSPTRQGLKIKANANDDEVAHEVAIALAEVSQRGGSPQASQTPSKRAESVMSSPFRDAQRKHHAADISNAKLLGMDVDDEDLEGSTEADTGELSRYKTYMTESVSRGTVKQKGRKQESKKLEVDNYTESHLDDKEECSGTEEGQRLGAARNKSNVEVSDTKRYRSSLQNQRKKSKKVLFGRDESSAFDALQTLADLSLMMPTEHEDVDQPLSHASESRVQFKDEDDDHVDESASLDALPVNVHKEKRKSSGVRMKRNQPISSFEVASSKTSKLGKNSAVDVSSAAGENQDPLSTPTKTARRKQKMQASKAHKIESPQPAIHPSASPGTEVGEAGTRMMTKNKRSSQTSSPKIIKNSEIILTADLRKEGSDSAQSIVDVSVVNEDNLPAKVRSRRKTSLKKPQKRKDLTFMEKFSGHQSNLALHDRDLTLKEKLSNCLSNPHMRKWSTYEWFYSAIDYPWFAKREFVEYLYHVGLGHVPRLTRVEWGVIRSSLGKPRRFSEHFLKEEKEKLNQYRDSVRKHYTELREGFREGLPTDLARPLSVGQHVIAIHPKSREIHDGSVLTVSHSTCHVQFDRHDLGVAVVMDFDCMPLNPLENIPTLLGRGTLHVDKFFENFNEMRIKGLAKECMKLSPGDIVDNSENFNEMRIKGLAKECMKLSPGDIVDNSDGAPPLSPFSNPASLSKHTKVASANANAQTRVGSADPATLQQTAYSQPSIVAHIQAKEADVQALAELTRALDKKEAVVLELRRMNDDVSENKDGDVSLKDSEPFKKQYAAVLKQLSEINEQVVTAIYQLRRRNKYQGNSLPAWIGQVTNLDDTVGMVGAVDSSSCQTQESGSQVNNIMDGSRTKAKTMVDAAVQAISSLRVREDTADKIEEAIDYVNEQLPSDDSSVSVAPHSKLTDASFSEAQIPSELITKCVATLLMIQKCTERQFPPSDVAQILDSAVMSLQPRSSQNLPVYTEIQKCMGIIRNQILALIPT